MYNTKEKISEIDILSNLKLEYISESEELEAASIYLYDKRKEAVEILDRGEVFINAIENIPEEINNKMKAILSNKKDFTYAVNLEKSIITNKKLAQSLKAGPLTKGIDVFGPNVAMAVATTFGSKPTGGIISTLSSTSATNAVLGWLSEGISSPTYNLINEKNTYIALTNDSKLDNEKLKSIIEKLQIGIINIDEISSNTTKKTKNISYSLKKLLLSNFNNYNTLTLIENEELSQLINDLNDLSKLINKRIDKESMKYLA